jgi:hypothetical protein
VAAKIVRQGVVNMLVYGSSGYRPRSFRTAFSRLANWYPGNITTDTPGPVTTVAVPEIGLLFTIPEGSTFRAFSQSS